MLAVMLLHSNDTAAETRCAAHSRLHALSCCRIKQTSNALQCTIALPTYLQLQFHVCIAACPCKWLLQSQHLWTDTCLYSLTNTFCPLCCNATQAATAWCLSRSHEAQCGVSSAAAATSASAQCQHPVLLLPLPLLQQQQQQPGLYQMGCRRRHLRARRLCLTSCWTRPEARACWQG